jgi:hypothetical protein
LVEAAGALLETADIYFYVKERMKIASSLLGSLSKPSKSTL